MCIKRLFKRKQYAPLYKVEDYGLHEAFLQVLDDIEEEGAPIDEEDLRQRLSECIEAFDDRDEIPKAVADSILNKLNAIQRNSVKSVNCPNCGAPMHGSKCKYCGTEP